MKKIFQFVSTNVLSGLENVVINICTLVKGYKFTYVSPNGPINKYLQKYHINHINVNRIDPINVRKVIKKYHPNIVHGHDVKASLSLAFNSKLCHKYNIKIISELHSDDPRMWHYSLRSLLYLISSPFYNRIVVISNAVINKYIFKKDIVNKTTVIPNIVNIKRVKNFPIYRKKNNHKKWDCIFLGRLSPEKDPIKFVRIIYLLKQHDPNIKAIIVGSGILYNNINNVIKELKLSNNIKMVGFKPNPYIYLSHSKLCIVPSKFEGFGLVALEALLVGTPVIASATGGLLNIITHKCGSFASTVSSFYRQSYKILNNEKLYDLKSTNAIEHAKALNNIDLFIYQYKKLYEKV